MLLSLFLMSKQYLDVTARVWVNVIWIVSEGQYYTIKAETWTHDMKWKKSVKDSHILWFYGFSFNFLKHLFVNACGCTHIKLCIWKSEDESQNSFFNSYGLKDQTEVVRLGDKGPLLTEVSPQYCVILC